MNSLTATSASHAKFFDIESGSQAMSELLNEIMDETAVLMAKISAIRRQVKGGEKLTEAHLARLKRHAVRIVNMLQALTVEK